MAMKTVTFDDEQWQIVPRQATHQMLMDLRPRAPDIVKVEREAGRMNICCDFGLIYRLFLAAAPALTAGHGEGD